MKRLTKNLLKRAIPVIIVLVFVWLVIYVFYSMFNQKTPKNLPIQKAAVIEPTSSVVDIYKLPRNTKEYKFPKNKPEFIAKVASVKTEKGEQQLITIYTIKDPKKPVFQRHFYDNQLHGKNLTYTISSDSASFSQNSSLGDIGCEDGECTLDWTNFYVWDSKQKAFVFENAKHRETFEQLQTSYKEIDEKGCMLAGGDIPANHEDLSLTQLYRQFPKNESYCSTNKPIDVTKVQLFLKAKKVLEDVVAGRNLGSSDIRKVKL